MNPYIKLFKLIVAKIVPQFTFYTRSLDILNSYQKLLLINWFDGVFQTSGFKVDKCLF
jgi:hypothetical protein